ncbi:MAG TPA: crossover junction endodeoxyribonuclease RuvC [Miltoncostaeaceae bacterium]|nr:crossover junction endodeoxyribonuclease RuvC [Miltoncostaeaceae bacterium]
MILGVDPGLASTGYAVVSGVPQRPRVVAWGVIVTAPGTPHATRLREIHDGLAQVLLQHPVEGAALETWHIHQHSRAAMGTAEARGAAQVALAGAGIAVEEYAPNAIKQAVTGSGRADKAQVRAMVERLTGVRAASDHASDAMAAALCHLSVGRFSAAVRRAG